MSFKNDNNEEKQIGNYILIKEIGSGGFAKVFLALHIPTGEKVAIKILNKLMFKVGSENHKRLQREISILKCVKHQNVIKLYEVMETPQKIYLVMELCENGELFDYILSNVKLNENIALNFFHQIINAIDYLHKNKIAHRDLKPENMLLDTHNNIKIIDFGISAQYSNLLSTPCGTVVYAPPEMHFDCPYRGDLCDVWSCGIVLYAMVVGYLPFSDDNENKNINDIINGRYEMPNELSDELKDMIKGCLNKDVSQRFDIETIKKHKWFNKKKYINKNGIDIGTNILIDERIVRECVKEYNGKSDLIENSVFNNLYDENNALYYIVQNKLKKEGYERECDLIDITKRKNSYNTSSTNSTDNTGTPTKKYYSNKNVSSSKKNIENSSVNVSPYKIKRTLMYNQKKKTKLTLSSSCSNSLVMMTKNAFRKDSNKSLQTSSFTYRVNKEHTVIHNRGASAVDSSNMIVKKKSINISSMRNNSAYSSPYTKRINSKNKLMKKINKHPLQLLSLPSSNSKIIATTATTVNNTICENSNETNIKEYNGMIDFKYIVVGNYKNIRKKLINVLTKRNVIYCNVSNSMYKFHCSKNGNVFNMEIYKLKEMSDTMCYVTLISKNNYIGGDVVSFIKAFYEE